MADNFPAAPATSGARNVATDQVTYSGDAADVQLVRPVFTSGSEGSRSVVDLAAGAGAVSAGTQRVTLASDDPAAASLAALNGKAPALGQALASASVPVVLPAAQLSSLTAPVLAAGTAVVGKVGIDQTTPGTTNRVAIQDYGDGDYETVAASQTEQVLGPTGATGDFLAGLLIVPAATAAGAVSIKDGSGSAITVFAGGGTTALTTLIPFFVPLGIKSTGGAWKVTTGASVSVIAVGNFA